MGRRKKKRDPRESGIPRMQLMTSCSPPTPASGHTIYFDAMSDISPTATMPPPIGNEYPYSNTIPDQQSDTTKHPDIPHRENDSIPQEKSKSDVYGVEHPNGSEGWLPTEQQSTRPVAETTVSPDQQQTQTQTQQTPSVDAGPPASYAAPRTSASLARSASKKSAFTSSEGKHIFGSAFVNGAGTTGPFSTVEADEELLNRANEAETNLSPKSKAKIYKSEAQDGKRLSKIIRDEGKLERQALQNTMRELEELQMAQKLAVKNEATAHGIQAKLLAQSKRDEAAFLAAKSRYETTMARLKAEEANVERVRNSAREATERVQDKSAEIDGLRLTFGVDEREREIKLSQLKSEKGATGFWPLRQ